MENEVWYDIPEFEGYYQYSNTLRIRSVGRLSKSKGVGYKNISGRIIKIVLAYYANGTKIYASATLSKKGKRFNLRVHRFFSKMFIPNPENKKYVNHKNGDKHDYSLSNLEWSTKSEDLKHAYDTGLKTKKKGIENPLYGRNVKPHSAKLVLDMETGIFYDSCLKAAISKNIPPANLSRYLNGVRKNVTSFVYV